MGVLVASWFTFLIGLGWVVIGTFGLVVGRGYIFGRRADGWPVRLIGAVALLIGLVIAVMGGVLGVF